MSRSFEAGAAAWLAAAFLALAAAVAPAGALAQDASPDAAATPQPAATVRDPDFGVTARHFGLERRVEMFQWRLRADGGYERTWSATPLDSSGYAPGHDNPAFPLRSGRWVARAVSVDGLPLDPAVLPALGRWEPFRPAFSALPGNLAATFQPQGDGLGTAEDPMAPRVGDLRLHWRELRLPPLAGRIALREGRWVLRAAPAATAPDEGQAAPAEDRTAGDAHRWFAAGLLLAAVVVMLVAARRRRGGRR